MEACLPCREIWTAEAGSLTPSFGVDGDDKCSAVGRREVTLNRETILVRERSERWNSAVGGGARCSGMGKTRLSSS
jgi:hypothetical protein